RPVGQGEAAEPAPVDVVHLHDQTGFLEVTAGRDLVEGSHAAGDHAVLLEQGDHLIHGATTELIVQFLEHRRTVRDAVLVGGEAAIADQLGPADGGAQLRPVRLEIGGDDHVPVGDLHQVGGRGDV